MATQRQLNEVHVEIVRVLGEHLLVDSEWKVHPYAVAGDALAEGIYLALCTTQGPARYCIGCAYVGPTNTLLQAETLKASAKFLADDLQPVLGDKPRRAVESISGIQPAGGSACLAAPGAVNPMHCEEAERRHQ